MKNKFLFHLVLLFLFLILGSWMTNAYYAPPDFAVYYSHAHTLFSDQDLDFRNEYEWFRFEKHLFYVTDAGFISNDWPPGAGILWGPFYMAGAVLAWVFRAENPGFSLACRSLVLWGILLFVGCGLLSCFWFLKKRFGERLSFYAVLLGFFGTPLLFYTYYGGMMSHATGFFVVTLFLLLWAETIEERKPVHWVMLGLLCGVAALVRPQHVICLITLIIELIFKMQKNRFKDISVLIRDYLKGFCLLLAFFLLAFLPQLIFWAKIYGSPFHLPKMEEMHWLRPKIYDTLFSDYHGILPWTPLVLPGLLGLFLLGKKNRILAWGLFACFALQVYVNSANEVWWAGGSFGNRRLTEYSFILMVGLCALFEKRKFWIIPGALMALWSFVLVVAERAGFLTLAHYVPWNRDFFLMILKVLCAPWNWLSALLGNFAGIGWAGRLGAALFWAICLIGVWRLINTRKSGYKKLAYVGSALFVYMLAINILVFVSAKRTPRPDQKEASQLYDSNRFLWNNYYEYGYFLLCKKRYNQALETYLKARALLPDRAQPSRYIGSIYEELGDYDKAEFFYREALEIDPNYQRVKMLLENLRQKRTNSLYRTY